MCHIWKTEYRNPLASSSEQTSQHTAAYHQPQASLHPSSNCSTTRKMVHRYKISHQSHKKTVHLITPIPPGHYFKHVKFKKRHERKKRNSLKTPIKIGAQPSCSQTIPLTLIGARPMQDCNSPCSEPYINQADNCFYTRLFTAIQLQN